MITNPLLGVGLHATGGLAAGVFIFPSRKCGVGLGKNYWLVGGFFDWIVAPLIVAAATVPHLGRVLLDAPLGSLFWCYFFGVLWGVGGLTFGLSMRYLGMSLGYALALGFCAAFGTVIPPAFQGEFGLLLQSASGLVTMLGVLVCLGGIAVCGIAGVSKEKELSSEEKKSVIQEFNFVKGVWVAVFAGVMSACMAFGIAAGKPIAALAVEHGVQTLWQNGPVFVIIFLGGFTTNFVWCIYLNISNESRGDYLNRATPLTNNYFFSALAGTIWYFQFMFYGMGTTQMGRYDFSSWTIHMAFIIVFSNLWGLFLKEWRGCSRRTYTIVSTGICILILSTFVIGYGNYLAAAG